MQLHAIEEVEGAKGKLTGGIVKVDYATGEVRTNTRSKEALRLVPRRVCTRMALYTVQEPGFPSSPPNCCGFSVHM